MIYLGSWEMTEGRERDLPVMDASVRRRMEYRPSRVIVWVCFDVNVSVVMLVKL